MLILALDFKYSLDSLLSRSHSYPETLSMLCSSVATQLTYCLISPVQQEFPRGEHRCSKPGLSSDWWGWNQECIQCCIKIQVGLRLSLTPVEVNEATQSCPASPQSWALSVCRTENSGCSKSGCWKGFWLHWVPDCLGCSKVLTSPSQHHAWNHSDNIVRT